MIQDAPAAGVVDAVEQTVRTLTLGARALSEFLLDNDDPCVLRELQRMVDNKASAKDKLEKDTKWQDEHQRVFKQHGYAWGRLKPNPMIANSALFLAAPPREKDIIALMPYIMPSVKRVDSSQTIGRCRPSAQEHVGACARHT